MGAKTLEYRHELLAAMRVLQDTASHLIEHISDPKVVSQCFLSEAATPSVFELAVESEANTFLNTKQARGQINSQVRGHLDRKGLSTAQPISSTRFPRRCSSVVIVFSDFCATSLPVDGPAPTQS